MASACENYNSAAGVEINVNGGTCIPDSLSLHVPCPKSKLNPKNSLKMRSASNSPTYMEEGIRVHKGKHTLFIPHACIRTSHYTVIIISLINGCAIKVSAPSTD